MNIITKIKNQILTKLTYIYIKDPFESKYELLIILINGRENFKNPKAFSGYSQTTDDVYENLEDYDPTKKKRVLITIVSSPSFCRGSWKIFNVGKKRGVALFEFLVGNGFFQVEGGMGLRIFWKYFSSFDQIPHKIKQCKL